MTRHRQLLRRAPDVRAPLNPGIQVGLDDVAADEFYALMLLEEEREKCQEERRPKQ